VTGRYWQCRCGAAGAYAVDDVLGLDGRFSKTVQKPCCRLAADVSFAATTEPLREMLGVRLAPETARAVVEGHGRAMATFQPQDEATAAAFRKAKGAVEFTVDAGKVNTREESWKDRKIAVISKREAASPRTPAQWEDRLPAATMVMAFALIATAQEFRRTWRGTLRRLGVTACAAVHALADGAGWIWKAVNRVWTGCLQTLDIYHANQHLSACAQAIHGEGTAEATAAFERGRQLLLHDGWHGVCAWVGEWLSPAEAAEVERRRPAADRLIGYFAKHVNRLDYRERLASGRAIGSGAVEGQAKTLGLRLKARGAGWKLANVRPRASLVCVRHSSQWDTYWSRN
jgi:hypothetical protein